MARNLLALTIASALSSCSPDVTIVKSHDAGPDACGAVAICESDLGCADCPRATCAGRERAFLTSVR